jgi:hypothetical protein
MNPGSRTNMPSGPSQSHTQYHLSAFPTDSLFTSVEQMRRFELLRLAFFSLKLCKLEQRMTDEADAPAEVQQELAFRLNLMRHVVFQQVLTLIKLDARDQAMQIIKACHS